MENSLQGIYAIVNLVNLKVYIGQSKNILHRWTEHKNLLRKNKHDNDYLQKSWNKYGEDNFAFMILKFCEKEDLDYEETKYLKKCRKYAYNLGHTNYTNTFSKETRLKMSLAKKGKPSWNKGKHLTEEHKMHLRKKHRPYKKRPCTEEHRRHLSESHKGKHSSPATEIKPGQHLSVATEFKKKEIIL